MSAIEKSPDPPADEDLGLGLAVLEAVGAASNTPVVELPPLNDAVDPEALDVLFSTPRTLDRAQFRYAGYLVTVHADRTIAVSPAEQ